MLKSFKVTPRILSHLGEDLIKNDSIALLELVKNAYDACANTCIVNFIFQDDKLNKIIIKDDGCGMSLYTIENVWLVVGTANKLNKIELNSCGRVPLGEKGIGRLGVHKLGKEIRLITKTGKDKEVFVGIDWKKLDSVDSIDDFKIYIEENNVPSCFQESTGTKIIISKLKHEWDKKQLRNVYRSINSLNSPFGDGIDKKSDSFRVFVKSNSANIFQGLPNFEEIKDAALYFAKCKLENDKIVDIRYEFKPWKSLNKIQAGRVKVTEDFNDFDLSLKTYERRKEIPIDLSVHKIGAIEFEVAIFDFDGQIFSYVNTEKTSIKNYLKENGGIRVYRDGVRVYDYGEKENDWLGIDLRRVHKVGGNISNHIVIGAVKLNRLDSRDLKEKTNREGFVENKAYHAFTDAVNYALDLIVNERNIDKSVLSNLYKKNKTIEPVLSDLEEVINLVNTKVQSQETKTDILKYLNRINNQYKEVKEILIKSANAGLNLSVVIHEIEKLIASLMATVSANNKEKSIIITKQLEKIIQGYSVLIKSSKIEKNRLSDIVSIAVDNYEFRFSDHNIEVITNIKNNELTAFFAKSEAISALTNLLDNAIFWLSYSRNPNPKISVYITDQFKGYNSIIVSDNGPGFGLPADIAVKPFITKKPNSIGSGLGLHIVNEMLKAMKGKVLFLDKYDVELPKKISSENINKAIVVLCFPKEK